jgi:hypothetical protein
MRGIARLNVYIEDMHFSIKADGNAAVVRKESKKVSSWRIQQKIENLSQCVKSRGFHEHKMAIAEAI